MKLKVLPILSLGLFLLSGFSSKGQGYVHADSLKGFLNAERACYDVGFYHLSLQINPADKSISGDVRIDFTAIQDFKTLQLDLWHNLELDSIVWQEITVKSIREHDAIHVTFPVELTAGSRHSIRVYYHGHPVEAANPPWNGGFTWAEDSEGNPWVSMSCEGEGASIWWACKDHFSDEPDSVRITAIVPAGLTAVGNGRPIGVYDTGALWTAFEWRVRNPINVYDVNITLGKMAHFSDHFNGAEGPLDLEYYVLSYTLDKAKKHFEQVKPMMACYEQHFGPYPFYEDSYKLVQTPFFGMEHQSSIAYGNNFKGGYMGVDNSTLGFDYIIIHESGHEWFGNSLTADDPADLWIHESFTTYGESVYVECMQDYSAAINYLNKQRWMIMNNHPIVGPKGVRFNGWDNDNDMYYKGAWMLQTIRMQMQDDDTWWRILKNFSTTYRHSIINTDTVINFFCRASGQNLAPIFRQYLYHKNLPALMYTVKKRGKGIEIEYRWECDEAGFEMPVRIEYGGQYVWIKPTSSWQKQVIKHWKDPDKLEIDIRHFLINTTQLN